MNAKGEVGNGSMRMLLEDQMIASNAIVIVTALFGGRKRKKHCHDIERVSIQTPSLS